MLLTAFHVEMLALDYDCENNSDVVDSCLLRVIHR